MGSRLITECIVFATHYTCASCAYIGLAAHVLCCCGAPHPPHTLCGWHNEIPPLSLSRHCRRTGSFVASMSLVVRSHAHNSRIDFLRHRYARERGHTTPRHSLITVASLFDMHLICKRALLCTIETGLLRMFRSNVFRKWRSRGVHTCFVWTQKCV